MASSSSLNADGKDMIARRVKDGWTKEEDDILRKLVAAHGTTSWSLISRSIPGRSRRSCRLRWCNQISPDVEHRPFTADEDKVVVDAQQVLGNRWADIARRLPGRTENSVKNRWYCSLKRKISPTYHGVAPKMIKPLQIRMPLPLQVCSPKRKFDSEVAGDANVIRPVHKRRLLTHPLHSAGLTIRSDSLSSPADTVPVQPFDIGADDPMTIISLALPGHRALPAGRETNTPYPINRPPVARPMTSPVEEEMSLMEDKIQELSQEFSAMRKLMILCELPQNQSVKIFGKTFHQANI